MFYYFLLESLTSKLRELGYPFTMGISPLKTVRRTVFAPRDADAGRGLFDSRTGHHLRPTPVEK